MLYYIHKIRKGLIAMTEFRENLLTRMIHIYGFEHKTTIIYTHMLEKAPQTKASDEDLENIVKALDSDPTLDKVFCSIVDRYIK